MIRLISEAISCIQLPYFILFIISALLLCFYKRKIGIAIILFFLFGFAWRSFFIVSSSRYCSYILIIGICAIIYALDALKKHSIIAPKKYPGVLSFALFLLITFNTFCLIRPFNNLYILDAKERTTQLLQEKDYSRLMIEQKELKRITSEDSVFLSRVFTPNQDKVLLNELNEYTMWGHPLYLLCFEKEKNINDIKNYTFHKGVTIRKLFEFQTNKQKTKVFSLYSFMPSSPLEKEYESIYISDNLIQNGNFEQLEEFATTQIKLKKWIESGIDFYNSPEHPLPKNDIILETWSSPLPGPFPMIFSDSANAIEGKYSLNITFPPENRSLVLLLNKVKSVPGKLSFYVKGLNNETVFALARWDFTENIGKVNPFSIYRFYLTDTKTHFIEISLDQQDYSGKDGTSMFFLIGADCSFLIDDVSFVPERNSE